MKILILGITGLIGRTMFKALVQCSDFKVIGTTRSKIMQYDEQNSVLYGIDLGNPEHLTRLFFKTRPDLVVNCAGLTKHLPDGKDPISALTMNALLPHRLEEHCAISGSRLIHVSTDCVFSGKTGNYVESDIADADDLYGKTKAFGEVTGKNVLTLRTSTIGHECGTKFGLLDWFLAQQQCKGFRYAIFSGLTTIEFARVVRDIVIPNTSLHGLYHVGSSPIDKLNLLQLIKNIYHRDMEIEANEDFRINRSLNSEKFILATGYRAPTWSQLIETMYQDYIEGAR